MRSKLAAEGTFHGDHQRKEIAILFPTYVMIFLLPLKPKIQGKMPLTT
jgi:hypothetical protein